MDTQQPAIANATATAAPKRFWHVQDPLAPRGKPREHEIIVETFDDGREPLTEKYLLPSEKPGLPMPMAHALKFLSDPTFIVSDPDGKRVVPPPKVDGGTGGYVIPDGQTIANWDELATSALYKRCQIIPGGERITTESTRDDMIQFLVSWRTAQRNGAAGIASHVSETEAEIEARASSGELGGQMRTNDIDKMFGGESPLLSQVNN